MRADVMCRVRAWMPGRRGREKEGEERKGKEDDESASLGRCCALSDLIRVKEASGRLRSSGVLGGGGGCCRDCVCRRGRACVGSVRSVCYQGRLVVGAQV